MNAAKWQAQWIWAANTAEENNVYAEARKTFQVDETAVGRAILRISANQSYRLYLNGEEVGRGPAPADLAWMSYDTYEVSGRLRNGANALAVVAHNFGREDIVTQQLQGPGGLICQLDLYAAEKEGGDEPAQTVASGADWKCRRSPKWKMGVSRLHQWGGFREIADIAREDGWEAADYDDAAWPQAVAVAAAEGAGSPWPRLLPREIPFLRQTLVQPSAVVAAEAYLGALSSPEALLASNRPGEAERADNRTGVSSESKAELTLDASVPGSIPQVVYDFGAELVGYPELEVFAEEGGVLQLFYGESLELALMDTFLLRKGVNRLSPFGRRAFRFLKLAAMATPAPLTVRSLRVRFVHYPYTGDGSFRCSDEKLNRIWETGRYTTIVNSQNHFEDCPYREAALWVADSVVMAKVVYQTFDDPALVRKSLLQSARIQNADGSIPGTGPQRSSFLLPDFCAHWLFGVWEHYAYSGDRAFLEEAWPYAVRLADWFADQEDESGLFARAVRDGWWCFIDWSEDIERKDRVTAVSCFYYKFLVTAGRIAAELGEPERAAQLRGKAEALRRAIRRLLRAPGAGVYADCLTADGLSASVTAQTNFAAAWSGVMDEAEIASFVRDFYLAGKLPPIRGAFFYHIVLETLFRYGWADEAVGLIRGYWGAMLDRGATTWWETFDLSLPFPTTPSPYLGHTPTYLEDAIPVSLSHGWGASPTYLLSREILGINVSDAGSGTVSLQPAAVAGIEWAEGVVPTKRGEIRAEWRRGADGTVLFAAELPSGFSWTASGLEETTASDSGGIIRVTGKVAASAREGAEAI